VAPEGDGPERLGDVVLLHGTGASGHSWRDLAPALARRRRVIVPDLPGHALTQRPPFSGLSLPGMAAALGELLRALDAAPTALVGHSAGAAIAARMVLDGRAPAARVVVSLNGAWLPPAVQGRWFYTPLARLFALNPLVAPLFSFQARQRGTLERLIASTGSRLDARGMDLYGHLVGDRAHVSAVLSMMAAWDLAPLLRDLPRLAVPLELLVGEGDRTVPMTASLTVQRLAPAARVHRLPGLGHLMHEEAPADLVSRIDSLTGSVG
jgi:magnesium chelatase accessory protein